MTPPDLTAHLTQCPLFAALTAAQLDLLAKNAATRRYGKGAVLWHEGEPNTGLFILSSGVLKVVQAHEDGRELTLTLLHPGEYFGEMSLLDGHPHSATVVAMEDSECVVVSRRNFLTLLEGQPAIALHLIQFLSKRVRQLDLQVADLMFRDVYSRVARKLAFLRDLQGQPEIAITQQELANLVGATRENVTRTLSEMARQGLVEVRKRQIRLVDPEGLNRLLL